MSVGIRAGPRKSGLSTDSLQQVPGGNFQHLRARRLARTSQGGSTQARTTHQSEPSPSLAQQSPLFSVEELPGLLLWFRGRNSGSCACRCRCWLQGGLSGRSLLLVTVTVIRVASAGTIGVCLPRAPPPPRPRKPANEDFLPVTLSPSFSGREMALWSHERTRSPPFVLGKKKKKRKGNETKQKPRDLFRGNLPHFLLGLPEPGPVLRPSCSCLPSVAS